MACLRHDGDAGDRSSAIPLTVAPSSLDAKAADNIERRVAAMYVILAFDTEDIYYPPGKE